MWSGRPENQSPSFPPPPSSSAAPSPPAAVASVASSAPPAALPAGPGGGEGRGREGGGGGRERREEVRGAERGRGGVRKSKRFIRYMVGEAQGGRERECLPVLSSPVLVS